MTMQVLLSKSSGGFPLFSLPWWAPFFVLPLEAKYRYAPEAEARLWRISARDIFQSLFYLPEAEVYFCSRKLSNTLEKKKLLKTYIDFRRFSVLVFHPRFCLLLPCYSVQSPIVRDGDTCAERYLILCHSSKYAE